MMELPEELDHTTSVLYLTQNAAIDHIKETVPNTLATIILTVYTNDDGEPACSCGHDGNIFTLVGALEMWLLNQKRIG